MYNQEIFKGQRFIYSGNLGLLDCRVERFTNEEGFELFDPKDILKLFRYNKNVFLPKLSIRNVFTVDLEEKDASIQYNADLITEDGIYELVMLLESPKARKIRSTIARFLSYERREKGCELEDFLYNLYKNINIVPLNSYTDDRGKLNEYAEISFMNYGVSNYYIYEAHEFPVLNGKVIKDELNDEDYIKHIDKAVLKESIKCLFGVSKTITALGTLFSVSESKIMETIKDLYDVTKPFANDNLYYTIDNILDYLKKVLTKEIDLYVNLKVDNVYKLYEVFLTSFFYDEMGILPKSVYEATIDYKDINESYSYNILMEYHKELDLLKVREGTISGSKLALAHIKNKYLK